MWNDAVDTTSNPGTTNRPPYQFNENQAGGIADADVVIIRDPNVPYARADNTGHPRYVRINPTWAATLTAAELKAAVAHELGHPHGLSNANTSASGCSQATTIMNGLNANLKPIVQAVQQRDVYQMNQSLNNPGNCCALAYQEMPLWTKIRIVPTTTLTGGASSKIVTTTIPIIRKTVPSRHRHRHLPVVLTWGAMKEEEISSRLTIAPMAATGALTRIRIPAPVASLRQVRSSSMSLV
jgi:hypothetical protein